MKLFAVHCETDIDGTDSVLDFVAYFEDIGERERFVDMRDEHDFRVVRYGEIEGATAEVEAARMLQQRHMARTVLARQSPLDRLPQSIRRKG